MPPKLYKFKILKKCPKCDRNIEGFMVPSIYDESSNTLERWCPWCGYEWHETCADGSQPNPEVEFEEGKVENGS